MNIRKIRNNLEYTLFALLIYAFYAIPPKAILMCIYFYGIFIIIEIFLFGNEYFKSVRKGIIILIRTRFSLSPEMLLRGVLIGGVFISGFFNWENVELNTTYGLLFTFVTFTESILFNKQKYSVRLDNERMLFDNIFLADFRIKDVKTVGFNSKKNILNIQLIEGRKYSVKIKEDEIEENEKLIENILNTIKENSQLITV